MTKETMYRYLGRNGIITSLVHLDGINYIPMLRLHADKNKLLTNGEKECKVVVIYAEDLPLWSEITDRSIQ